MIGWGLHACSQFLGFFLNGGSWGALVAPAFEP